MSSAPPLIQTRFLQLRDAVVSSVNSRTTSFHELPAALRELEARIQRLAPATLKPAPPPRAPVDIHAAELLAKKKKNVTAAAAAALPPTTLFAHFRREEVLSIGCALDRVPAAAAALGSLRYASYDPRARTAAMNFTVVSGAQEDDTCVESEKHHLRNGLVTGEVGPSLEAAFLQFVRMFDPQQQQQQPATDAAPASVASRVIASDYVPVATGEFFLVLPDTADWTRWEMHALLAREPAQPVPIVLDHDAGVDDVLALLLLASASVRPLRAQPRRIQLIGTTIVDADCFGGPAGELCRRVLALFDAVSPQTARVPVGVSPLPGTAAPFPDEWRKDCITMLDLPVLHSRTAVRARLCRPAEGMEPDGHGHELLAKLVMESPTPVSLVVTGPLTNVAWCLRTFGERFARNVREISVMGGAVFVKGNVENRNLPPGTLQVDTSAEWNIYWAAADAKLVLESELLQRYGVPILLFSTDATNHVPVTSRFVRRFGKVCHATAAAFDALPVATTAARCGRGSDFGTTEIDKLLDNDEGDDVGGDDGGADYAQSMPTALASIFGSSWATVTFLKALYGELGQYAAWDVLAASGLIAPQICRYALTRVTVEAAKVPSEGRTTPVQSGGGLLRVGVAIDAAAFENLVLECATLL